MKYSVYIFDRFHEDGLKLLQSHADLSITHEVSPFANLQQEHPHEIVITRSRTKINEAFLQVFPRLQMIVSATSGFDHIDLQAIAQKKLQAEYCPEANADSAAELTWALLLATSRHLPHAHHRVSQAKWRDESIHGRQIKGKKILIIGFGRIGKRVGDYARAFQMQVLVYDPYISELPSWAKKVNLEEGLQECDYVTLHVPKTTKTFHLLNQENLALLSSHAILINTSRGDVVEEKALIHLLQNKAILGAGLDVFSKEPLAENTAFLDLKNVVLSPHAGAFTEEAFQQGSIQSAQKVLAFIHGKPASDPLPPKAKWVEDLDTTL